MSIHKELAYERVVSKVTGVQFCILSEQEIRRRSVVEVTENQAFAGNEPVPNGLFDPRMGVIDNMQRCATCNQTNKFCPGHFGHIELARPVFYIQFFDIVRKIMRCVCFRCSRILVNLNSPEARAILGRKMSRQRKWDAMSKLCLKVKRCGHDTVDGCGAKMPDKISKTDDLSIRIKLTWKESAPGANDGKETIFSAEDVLRVLRRISDVDSEAMGFSVEHNRPEWMICTCLPVPPPSVRPSVRQDGGQRQEDDITHKLADILKFNNIIRDRIAKDGAGFDAVESNINYVPLLQYHVATLIDNSIPSMYPAKDRAGRMLRTLTERLRHKEGRIRGNLMGKRVDFSARTVITPDPNLSIDELGVPLKIAMNLTFPEVVGPINRDELQRLVLAGPDVYPGAKQVRHGSRTVRLRGHPDRASIILEDGDVVERHLRNGDYVLFNRQPSLHKMSMMGHRVRVMDYNTFRLNVCVCSSYNADFDGDEMNMHVPQSLQTLYEIQELAAVPLHILTPRSSTPIITIVQDILLGVHRITQPGVKITKKQLFNLVCNNPLLDIKSIRDIADSATGRRVLSTVLPPTTVVHMNASDVDPDKFNPDVHAIRIHRGRIESGVLSNEVFSSGSVGLVHSVYNTLGPAAVVAMLNATQTLICDWLVLSGFSVGISDLIVPPEVVTKQRKLIKEANSDVGDILRSVHDGSFKNASTKNNTDYLEDMIIGKLNNGTDKAGKLSKTSAKPDNRMLNMIDSGSKGKNVNFYQVTACLGQQSIEGKRVVDGFDHRTLPHFCKYDDGPESRGYVKHSFIDGLSPHEFFFHSMAGRIGLINTAVRTSETGYLQRRLVKAMEDCKIHHDGTVRNANNYIVQFLYGEDGMDAIKLEHHKMPYLDKDVSEMAHDFLVADAQLELGLAKQLSAEDHAALAEHFRELLADRQWVVRTLCDGLQRYEKLVYPVHIDRIIAMVADSQASQASQEDPLDPVLVLGTIKELTAELRPNHARNHQGTDSWMGVLLRCFLSPKRLILKYRITASSFSRIVEIIRRDYWDAFAHAGEMVGIVAAQSIGEISTQLTLNSVDWRTELLLSVDGALKRVQIGDFIDSAIEGAKEDDMERHPNRTTLAWINRPGMPVVKILSPDEDGKVAWQLVEAVTQHPPINEDGSATLLKVTTATGREVIATKAKSFLLRKGNKLVASRGDELKIGDYLPVSDVLPPPSPSPDGDDKEGVKVMRLSDYLPKTSDSSNRFVFTSEVEKAKSKMLEKKRPWFKANNGALFHVPYSRSDSFTTSAFVDIAVERGFVPKPDCVYPKYVKTETAHIPEEIPLDEEFGFFMGAYAAEGGCTEHAVMISNLDAGYIQKIDNFCSRYSIKYHIDYQETTLGRSNTIRMHSLVLAQLLIKSCGTGAANKRIPVELLSAPTIFKKAFIDGYFSGDGTVSRDSFCVSAVSVSRGLLEDVSNMLVGFGIRSSVRAQPAQLAYALNRGFNAVMIYRLDMGVENSHKFAQTFTLCIKSKQDRLLQRNAPKIEKSDVVPGITLGEAETISLTKAQIRERLQSDATLSEEGKGILRAALDQDVFYDRVVSIKEVESPYEFVYDLTVEKTRTFQTYHGLCQYDTFHNSGIAQFTKVTSGIPRMKELMSISKNIKTPMMKVHLQREWGTTMEGAMHVLADIKTTHFRDVVKRSAIFFDPDGTALEEDGGMLKFHNDFCGKEVRQLSPWVLRFEFDRSKMLELSISMLDIETTLIGFYDSLIHCIVSDDNATRLVCRINLALDSASTDLLTDIKALEQSLMEGLVIKGIRGIEKAMQDKPGALKRLEGTTHAFVEDDAWTITTAGSNLLEVMAHPCVDYTKTITNDVYEVYRTLGIEAARKVLFDELDELVKLNYRHLSLLVDVMTNRGAFMSIDRHGINNRGELGPLAKCSFEQTIDMLIKAGIFAERDALNGVSANTMLGQVAPCGTGDCSVRIDFKRLQEMAQPATSSIAAAAAAAADADAENVDAAGNRVRQSKPMHIEMTPGQGNSLNVPIYTDDD